MSWNQIRRLLLTTFLFIISISFCENFEERNIRTKRYLLLLFRDPSITMFICGFGIPVSDLDFEIVTIGMVFKCPQILPGTTEALKHFSNHTMNRRQTFKDEADNNLKRISHRVLFYKALEQLSASLGQSGHICVLKMICEAASIPFHHNNGVLGEIIHILLTPSTSLDYYGTEGSESYSKAEYIGRSGQRCEELFQDCQVSLLERISHLLE